ncbi:tRNA adenosine(34) deaminase TadA [Anaerobiospirillum sp. NML120448]|uniref:tRNA adenosine(34) deaminase TadA n=1 Tax=Anaerobiospirillum sp. NML120448 TaxID=2932816 RepID=UPI001FF4A124|nr:tRNA adenosine(34) deaminase TadA [Anaerobiospirillum sp. NML120448]MCK0515070.1 tRNA adenosine(34) deaminase TadA [Anaerobiospirillum sp. NML120448]
MENNNECNFDILNQPGIKFRHLKVHRGGAIVFDIRVVCDFESLDLKNKPLNNKGKVLSSISVGSVKNPLGLGVLEYSAIFLRYFPQYKDRLIFVTKQGIFEQNSTAKDSNDSFHLLCAFENNILKLGSKKLLSKIAEQESQSKSEVDINVSCLNEVLHTCKSNNALTEQASVSQEQSAQVQVQGQGHDLSQGQGQKQSPADALLNSDDINLVKTNNDAQVKNKTSTGITQEVEFDQRVGAIEKVSSCRQQVSDYYDDINVLSGNCPSTRPNLSQQTNKAQAYDLSNGSSLNELSAQNNSKHSHSSEDNHRVDSESTASKGQQATNTTATNTAATTNTTRPVLRVSDRPMNASYSSYDNNIVNTKVASKSHNDKQSNTEQKVTCSDKDRYYMSVALELAQESALKGEVPVGAIIVDAQGNIVGGGNNQTITNNDPSAHAEIIALRNAGKNLCNYRMNECTMYVTLEPCCMCAMALVHARLKEVVFGAYDPKTGACGSMLHLINDYKHNHKVLVRGGVMQEQCASVLSQFFARRREEKKAEKQDKANQANQD